MQIPKLDLNVGTFLVFLLAPALGLGHALYDLCVTRHWPPGLHWPVIVLTAILLAWYGYSAWTMDETNDPYVRFCRDQKKRKKIRLS